MNGADTHRLYVNVQVANPANAKTLQPARFTCNLIEGAGIAPMASFDATVARFFLPLSSLPYFDSAKQQFFITLTYNGVDYKQQVTAIQYVAGDTNVYYVQQWIDSINIALKSAYAALIAAITATSQFWPNRPPFLQFNSSTNLISLITDAGSWENTASGSPIIWFNTALALQLRNLPQFQVAYNSASGKDSYVIILQRGVKPPILLPVSSFEASNMQYISACNSTAIGANTSITLRAGLQVALPIGTQLFLAMCAETNSSVVPTQLGDPGYLVNLTSAAIVGATSLSVTSFSCDYKSPIPILFAVNPTQLVTTEESPSVVNWWTTTRICLVSNLLGARNELNTFPEVAPIGGGQSGLLTPQNILADYVITPADRLQGNTTLVMIPTPDFRWFDLMSEGDFKMADFAFYATDDIGPQPQNLSIVNFEPGQGGGIKLLFSKHTITSRIANYERTKELKGGNLLSKIKRRRLL